MPVLGNAGNSSIPKTRIKWAFLEAVTRYPCYPYFFMFLYKKKINKKTYFFFVAIRKHVIFWVTGSQNPETRINTGENGILKMGNTTVTAGNTGNNREL